MARKVYNGIGIGSKHALGVAFVYRPKQLVIKHLTNCDRTVETDRLQAAAQSTRSDLLRIKKDLETQNSLAAAGVCEAQLEFLDDVEYFGNILKKIDTDAVNAEAAVDFVRKQLVAEFREIDDDYFRERAVDIDDISNRILTHLLNVHNISLREISAPCIIVATDLAPSETMQLDTTKIIGICTERGIQTSHTALLAQSFGIPAIVGCSALPIAANTHLLLNCAEGTIVAEPTENEIAEATQTIRKQQEIEKARLQQAHKPAKSTDGINCAMLANIGGIQGASKINDYGAEGIGLLRTELFFYQRDTLPSEEEQIEFFTEVASYVQDKPLTIRTLDVGGDKPLAALQGDYTQEQNPFLGVRGVRLTMQHPAVFRTQLRAILRTVRKTPTKVMIPFIATVPEMRLIRHQIDKIQEELDTENIPYHTIEIGAMIEIPSAALLIEQLLSVVDFVSIGTNDLTQYVLAVDRTNERISNIADYCDPAILLLIDRVINASVAQQKAVSICGEMAGDPLLIPLLFGMGLRTFSMSAIRIPEAKALIATLNMKDCQTLKMKCLQQDNASAVRAALNEFSQQSTA